jgi:hypothetical protein
MSIDLTDEDETPQPPALVAIRNNSIPRNVPKPSQVVRTADSLSRISAMSPKGSIVHYDIELIMHDCKISSYIFFFFCSVQPASKVYGNFKHPASLPMTPSQVIMPGTKKIPPKPSIKASYYYLKKK